MLKDKLNLILSMTIFGTIGIVSSFIPMSPQTLVFYRASLASIFLIIFVGFKKIKLNFVLIRKKIFLIILTGVFLGTNWVFLFEAFRVASVSVGTVCYNTMPIMFMLIAPFLFSEKLKLNNIVSIIISIIGIVLVSNVIVSGIKANEFIGCLFGLLAALFYALTLVLNKKMTQLNSYEKIIIQFIVSALIMIPYIFFSKNSSFWFEKSLSYNEMIFPIIMLLVICFIHTGFAYIIYFNSVGKLSAQNVAIFTYIDPVVALLLSNIILKEKLNLLQIIGAILILASTFFNELFELKNIKNKNE